MKMHCYFLLNIKHGASQFYWGRPPNTTTRPQRGVDCGRACLWASLGPRGGLGLGCVCQLQIVYVYLASGGFIPDPSSVSAPRLPTPDPLCPPHLQTLATLLGSGLKLIHLTVQYVADHPRKLYRSYTVFVHKIDEISQFGTIIEIAKRRRHHIFDRRRM